ncbi:hypothetical protein [Nocardioides panacisoli]
MNWFRRLQGQEDQQVWYVATVRRDDGKVVEVPFRTSATGRGPVRRKARIAIRREGYIDATLLSVRRRDA